MGVTWTLWLSVTALVALWVGVRAWRRCAARREHEEQAAPAVRCDACGYVISGLELPRCPECGALRGFKVPLDQLGISEEELRELHASKRGGSLDARSAESGEGI